MNTSTGCFKQLKTLSYDMQISNFFILEKVAVIDEVTLDGWTVGD